MLTRVLRALEVPSLVAVPVVLLLCAFFEVEQTALLTAFVCVVALLVFIASFESSRPNLRQLVPAAVLGALAAAGRLLFAAVPSFKPVEALCIMGGAVFGRRCGFMVGALAALISNMFFGQGAWTPWQMYAWGLVGYLAGVLADHSAFKRRWVIVVYGFVGALLYGALLNSWTFVGFVRPLTWESALLTYGAGLPYDAIQGVATVVFLLALYVPWTKKLERVRDKYELAPDNTKRGCQG